VGTAETKSAPTRGTRAVADTPLRGWRRAAAWAAPLAAALTGLAAGGYRLGQPPLWRDEAATKEIAGRSVRQILATLPHDDAVHGAYYILIHLVSAGLGTSITALRVPSVIGMAIACAFIALVTRDLVLTAGGPFADLTGLAAGVIFAMTPATIGYAQEARSYAIVTMLAAIATYLLTQAVKRGGARRWWAAYGVAIALTGLLNLFGLLLIVAHGLSLLIVSASRRLGADRDLSAGHRPGTGRGIWLRWLTAAAIAAVILVPVAVLAYSERAALGWLPAQQAWWPNFMVYFDNGLGSVRWAGPITALVIAGAVAELAVARGRVVLGPAAIAVPWLLAPPALLLTVSMADPVWDTRYVEFCAPAFAILIAWTLNWLARLAAAVVPRALAWLPLAAGPLLLILAFIPPTTGVRTVRPDNLLAESQIIARNAQPGDIVFYLPINDRIVSMPFPGPFQKLRDIALAQSPVASDTLYGIDVSPAELLRRYTHVTRVWVITSSEVNYLTTGHVTPLDAEEGRLISALHVIAQWRDGDTMLTLYAERLPEAAQQVIAGTEQQVLVAVDVHRVAAYVVHMRGPAVAHHRRRVRYPVAQSALGAVGNQERRRVHVREIPRIAALPEVALEVPRHDRHDGDLGSAVQGDAARLPVAADAVGQVVRGQPAGQLLVRGRRRRLDGRVTEAGQVPGQRRHRDAARPAAAPSRPGRCQEGSREGAAGQGGAEGEHDGELACVQHAGAGQRAGDVAADVDHDRGQQHLVDQVRAAQEPAGHLVHRDQHEHHAGQVQQREHVLQPGPARPGPEQGKPALEGHPGMSGPLGHRCELVDHRQHRERAAAPQQPSGRRGQPVGGARRRDEHQLALRAARAGAEPGPP
jgi:mannosyltransferase